MAYTEEELKKELETKEYEYGFYTDIDSCKSNFKEKGRARMDRRMETRSL